MPVDVEGVLYKVGVDYEESGDRFMVCCPFHHDTNPSCGLWRDTGYFRCFGCGEEGSLVDFVAQFSGVTSVQAFKIVKGQSSLSNLEDTLGRLLDREETEFQYFKWSSFAKTFPEVLPETRAWDYLKGRGLSDSSIRRFNIRWGGDVGKYRHRVVLPILDPERRLVAYVGRAIYGEMVPKTRKNRSPHRTLFGLRELLRQDPDTKTLVVVEGEFDAIYLQQYGIPAVANMGTSPFNAHKIRQLRKYGKRMVVLSYDGDEAGIRAMHGDGKKQGALRELSRHVPTVAVRLPEGSDPNELSEKDISDIYGGWRFKNV